jgi:hypothetical protein
MKKISTITQSKSNPEWYYANFEAYRNDAGHIIKPETMFFTAQEVKDLDIKDGDIVA